MSSVKEANPINKISHLDKLTPYRISLSVMIYSFYSMRVASKSSPMPPKSIRDFCIMLIKLLQKPDLEMSELWNRWVSDNKEVAGCFHCFSINLKTVISGIESLFTFMDGLNRLMEYDNCPTNDHFFVSKRSVIGVYLRRLIINFNKLSFYEVTQVYSELEKYCESIDELTSESNIDLLSLDRWTIEKDLWSRRQAELFIASQAALVESNEGKAMNPRDLQIVLANILKTNPYLAEAHFLAYLNYLRVREYCGAIESLYGCFDLNHMDDVNNSEDKPKLCRYAALNLAILHYHFNNDDETFASLKEAIKLAQDTNDNLCLQHSIAWLHKLIISHNDIIGEHSVLSSFSLNMSYRSTSQIQNSLKIPSLCCAEPLEVLEALEKAELVHNQNNDRDLISNSYAIKSCLWRFYGKAELSSLWSYLVLYLNIGSTKISAAYFGEPFCLSVCNIAMHLLSEGKYNLAYCALNFLKKRYPNEPNCQIWMLCENVFYFTRALYNEQWVEAEAAARRMMVLDKWESYLRLSELYHYKGDHKEARRYIDMIFDRYKTNNKHEFKGYKYVRAKLLLAQIEFASNIDDTLPPGIMNALNDVLDETKKYKLDYHTSLIYLMMANIQLSMGKAKQALVNLDKCMIQILAHGGCYDRARCWLSYIRALTAESDRLETKDRKEVIIERIDILGEAKNLFHAVEAHSRVKDVVYLQAKLYYQLGMKEKRNQHALEFRTLEQDHFKKNMENVVRYV